MRILIAESCSSGQPDLTTGPDEFSSVSNSIFNTLNGLRYSGIFFGRPTHRQTTFAFATNFLCPMDLQYVSHSLGGPYLKRLSKITFTRTKETQSSLWETTTNMYQEIRACSVSLSLTLSRSRLTKPSKIFCLVWWSPKRLIHCIYERRN